MSYSVEIKGTPRSQEYPYVGMREDGLVVLFRRGGEGVVIRGDEDGVWEPGEHSAGWVESAFPRLSGSVTITST